MTCTATAPIGTSQPGPMTFQYSSSPECWVFAGLSQPSTVNCTWYVCTPDTLSSFGSPMRRISAVSVVSWLTCAGAPVELDAVMSEYSNARSCWSS